MTENRREFLRKAPGRALVAALAPTVIAAGCGGDTQKASADTFLTYPRGWHRVDGKVQHEKVVGNKGESLEGQPIDFKFTDIHPEGQKAGTFTPADMKGKHWITAYIFAGCGSGVCPNTVNTALEIKEEIKKRGLQDKIGVLMVDINPLGEGGGTIMAAYEGMGINKFPEKGFHIISGNTGRGVIPEILPFIEKTNPSMQYLDKLPPAATGLYGLNPKTPVQDFNRHTGQWDIFDGEGIKKGFLTPNASVGEIVNKAESALTQQPKQGQRK